MPDLVLLDLATGAEKARKPLPAYGATTHCPKCDTAFAATPPGVRWKPHGERGVLDGGAVVDDEAMIRTCRTCGFTYAEAPKKAGR